MLDTSPSDLRGDQHPGKKTKRSNQYHDCFHFCYPSGGGDLWARFFYHMLVQFKARQQLDGSLKRALR